MPLLDAIVSRYMSPSVRAVYPDDSLDVARTRLDEWKISALAVVEEVEDSIRLCGVITRSDLIRLGTVGTGEHSQDRLILPDATVASGMTTDVICVDESDLVEKAAQLMVEHEIHRVFVVSRGGVAGVLSTRDVMRAIADRGIEHPISEYMSQPVIAMHAATPIADAIRELDEKHIQAIVVLDQGWPCGVFRQEDALAAKTWRGDKISDAMDVGILVLPENTPLDRASGNAAGVDVRSVIVHRDKLMVGIMSGLDFCRAVI